MTRKEGPWKTTDDERVVVPGLSDIARSMVKGETLDAMAGAVNVTRMPGESDRELKDRITQFLNPRFKDPRMR
jgi:hypothetical protein